MKSFLNYAKNRFLYNLLRLAIAFGLGLIASQFLFIQEVKALQTEPGLVQFYDNYGTSLVAVDTELIEDTYYGYLGLTAGSTGGAIGLRLNENIVSGHMYSLTVNVGVPAGGYTTASSKNIIGVGSTMSNATSSYINSTGSTINYTQGGTTDSPYYISFVFTSKTNGSYIIVPYNTINGCSGSCENFFKGYTLNDLGLAENLSDDEVNTIINNQTSIINNTINEMETNISNDIDNMEDSINNTINDSLNDCRDSKNLFPGWIIGTGINSSNGSIFSSDSNAVSSDYISVDFSINDTYTLSGISTNLRTFIAAYNSNKEFLGRTGANYSSHVNFSKDSFTSGTAQGTGDIVYIRITSYNALEGDITQVNDLKTMLNVGNSASDYEEYGEQVCQSKIDETNEKLDQAEETRKGIWQTIKDLPGKFLDMLKSLFIPDDNFFSNWFDEFMSYVELKLGFLATPFTIFIDFIEAYLDLSPDDEVIINIPDITVPNFEDNILIHATSFNWSETLKSKESLNNLWQLYLDFVDVFLILNFIGLCESVYNRIFGGNTANYEYYTVEDSYTYDNQTGEVLSSRRNERVTKRQRSDG